VNKDDQTQWNTTAVDPRLRLPLGRSRVRLKYGYIVHHFHIMGYTLAACGREQAKAPLLPHSSRLLVIIYKATGRRGRSFVIYVRRRRRCWAATPCMLRSRATAVCSGYYGMTFRCARFVTAWQRAGIDLSGTRWCILLFEVGGVFVCRRSIFIVEGQRSPIDSTQHFSPAIPGNLPRTCSGIAVWQCHSGRRSFIRRPT